MTLGYLSAASGMAMALLGTLPAVGAEPATLFREAMRHDLTGRPAEVRIAFDLYHRAAVGGLPEAQFNVAVMLDSGRGVTPDVAQAAIWYARAASRGNKRAAFNLGQLYEAGQGVPRNPGLARAWFKASALPAARLRLAALRTGDDEAMQLTAPRIVAPTADEVLGSGTASVELVWTSWSQPGPVRFFVEVREVFGSQSQEIYSGFADTSSVNVVLPDTRSNPVVWRVLAVATATGRYAASEWAHLRKPIPAAMID